MMTASLGELSAFGMRAQSQAALAGGDAGTCGELVVTSQARVPREVAREDIVGVGQGRQRVCDLVVAEATPRRRELRVGRTTHEVVREVVAGGGRANDIASL